MLVAAHSAARGPQLVSSRDASLALPAGGNGDSVPATISPDGRYVLFASWASDLTTNAIGQFDVQLYRRDRRTGSTVLVSANATGLGGGNAPSLSGAMSANGRYVVFESKATDLVRDDTNNASDVFVRDLAAGVTQMVSVAPDGAPGNGASTEPVITPDGRYVVFLSTATNLVAADTNRIADVFIRDLTTATTRLVSAGAVIPTGASVALMATPGVTSDGRYVVFNSTAAGMAAGIPALPTGEIYLRDLVQNITLWASSNAASVVSTNLGLTSSTSQHPVMSDDARYIAFKSGSSDGTGPAAILLFDAATATTTVAATNGIPGEATGVYDDVFGPEITPDGSLLVFARMEQASSNYSSLQLWSAATGLTTLISANTNGGITAKTAARSPRLSCDGNSIAFLSNDTNLTANPLAGGFHLFLWSATNGLRLVDAASNGAGSSDLTGVPVLLTTNGQGIVFSAPDGALTGNDCNQADDVLFYDATTSAIELISARAAGLTLRAGNHPPILMPLSLSDDGRWTAYSSFASDLVPGDTNGLPDVFLHDLFNGTNLLVSRGFLDGPSLGGLSYFPALSGDGSTLVFLSLATNLVAGFTNGFENLFVANLATGVVRPVTLNTNGLGGGDGDTMAPVISRNGRCVAFLSKARNLVPGTTTSGTNAYWHDCVTGGTVRLNNDGLSVLSPSMSADGRFVAYSGSGGKIWIWDSQKGTNVYTNTSAVTSFALSPDARRLLYQVPGVLYAWDLSGSSNLVALGSTTSLRPTGQWTTNANCFVFTTAASAVAADTNGTNDVYLYDLETKAAILVSSNATSGASGNAPSDAPSISADGRFVAYRSFATDIVPGADAPPNAILFDLLTGSNTLINPAGAPPCWSSWTSTPLLVGSSGTVLFESVRSAQFAGERLREPEILATFNDQDGDGIPDAWMLAHFGHATAQTADNSRAQDDADGDGQSNLEEFLAGTDPMDATSYFGLHITPPASAGQNVTLSWRAMPARGYQLFVTEDLSSPVWQPVAASPIILGNQAQVRVPVATPARYYKVVATY
jgi:Tol biopolymer transport system component